MRTWIRVPRLTAPWVRFAATAAVVELIAIGGTGLGPHKTGRPVDLVALVLLVVAAGATAFARHWPVPALAASLAGTVLYYGLGYPTDSPFFVGLLVTGYLSASARARLRAAVVAVLTPLLFAVAT